MDTRKPSAALRRYGAIFIGIIALSFTAQAQWYYPGTGLYLTSDSAKGGALVMRVDTVWLKLALNANRNLLDSLKNAGYFGGGGGRVYVRDSENLAGTIDSSGALYTLHYALDNSFYAEGGITSFSNQATDSTNVRVGIASNGLLLPGSTPVLERFAIATDVPSVLYATFNAHPPIGNDSTMISIHIVNRGGNRYLTVWKHHIPTVGISISTTTAGTMILEQLINPTFQTLGTNTQFRFSMFLNRRRR